MGKFWAVFFGAVLLACFLSLALSPVFGWVLPRHVSSIGDSVDFLYYVILGLTAFFFILTEALLVIAMWRFGHRPDRRSTYIHGSHRLEMAWTIVPAAILLYIAFAQIPAWARMKSIGGKPTSWFVWGSVERSEAPVDQVIQVTARQWEWRLRYGNEDNVSPPKPLDWADHPQIDDLHTVNEVHTWFDPGTKKGAHVRVYLKTVDVIHSFFLPNMRIKQDALPGRTIPIWFQATEANCKYEVDTDGIGRVVPLDARTWARSNNEWELTCAELCGGRHYAMRGRFYVHQSKEDYLSWLADVNKDQNQTEPGKKHGAQATGE